MNIQYNKYILGLIIKLPLIDCIEVIDLCDIEFDLVDNSKQLMTSK